MRYRLHDQGLNKYSQFGEDGMLLRLLADVGVAHQRAGEVGAGDGLHLSNTARWWKDSGWEATLVEKDLTRFYLLEENTWAFKEKLEIYNMEVNHENVNNVFVGDFDILSIDIDGDDWFVFAALTTRPRIVVIEFNPSIPYWLGVYPTETGHALGASALAMKRLAETKGYRVVGATHCNLILLRDDIRTDIEFEDDLGVLLGTSSLTYMPTDFNGKPFLYGNPPPWGFTGFTEKCDVPMEVWEERK